MDPFIEIWDRNRSETDIDGQEGARARAVAKVRNGVIEKVVVLEGGRGYVDPVVYVREVRIIRMFQKNAQIILEYRMVAAKQWSVQTLESNDGSIVNGGIFKWGSIRQRSVRDPGGDHTWSRWLQQFGSYKSNFKTTNCSEPRRIMF